MARLNKYKELKKKNAQTDIPPEINNQLLMSLVEIVHIYFPENGELVSN